MTIQKFRECVLMVSIITVTLAACWVIVRTEMDFTARTLTVWIAIALILFMATSGSRPR